ncbi:MAG: DoxX family protein [Acidimicrobiaceae bacterium]|nr:DoxX family protein [Acidimicrobiaceae bacterium]MCY4279966.1 DoxX family protein [Acidimicrobiaceae bacterium]MCY4294419.1 DoxX family protein [Acidimicrobiaceae bacterium]
MNDRTADKVLKALTVTTVAALALAVLFYDSLFADSDGFALLTSQEPSWTVDAALLILRASLGMMIFAHGYNKAFRGGRIAGTAGWFQAIGMRPGAVHARLAAGTEMGVGVLLVLGLLTSAAAAGLIAVMLVAFWTAHRGKGFMITGEGWEYVALIAAMSLVCAMVGPGSISLDAKLDVAHRLDGGTGLGIALLLGLGAGAAQLLLFYRPPASGSD